MNREGAPTQESKEDVQKRYLDVSESLSRYYDFAMGRMSESGVRAGVSEKVEEELLEDMDSKEHDELLAAGVSEEEIRKYTLRENAWKKTGDLYKEWRALEDQLQTKDRYDLYWLSEAAITRRRNEERGVGYENGD